MKASNQSMNPTAPYGNKPGVFATTPKRPSNFRNKKAASYLPRMENKIRLTKLSSQPLAGPMFSFQMTSTLNSGASLALASGG
jgi:hypothetical protein